MILFDIFPAIAAPRWRIPRHFRRFYPQGGGEGRVGRVEVNII